MVWSILRKNFSNFSGISGKGGYSFCRLSFYKYASDADRNVNIIFAGATDERTFEPASKTDVGGPVPAAEPAIGHRPVAGRRSPTRAVASLVLAAGIQLRGLPEAAGHRERVSGERDRTVVGQADSGHG